MFQREVGINPVRLLYPKLKTDKPDNRPRTEGIAPDSMLFARSRCLRLVRLPKSTGISLDNLLLLKDRYSIDRESVRDNGIFPDKSFL